MTAPLDRAQAIANRHMPPRFLRLDRLERYVEGTQYEGRPSFIGAGDVPLLERAPAIVYPIVEAAIRTHVDYALGEGRWPTITSWTSEDDADDADGFGLSEDDSETLDKFVAKVVEQSRAKSMVRALLEAAEGCGTSVAICVVRDGKLAIEQTRAKWCSATFDPQTRAVERLEIRYPYLAEEWDDTGKRWEQRCYVYRRAIDAVSDVTYEPALAPEDGAEPLWVEDTRVDHGLGFCPVVWYRFLPEVNTVADVDGHAVHKHLLDEVDALNFGLSQRFRAALYAGDPQLWETGVRDDEQIGAMGRQVNVGIIPGNSDGKYATPGRFGVTGGSGGAARKKGPGSVWTYEDPQAKVGMLTLPGDALQAIADQCTDLRGKICEALAFVPLDPDTAKLVGDLSGKAIEALLKRMLVRVDTIRADAGDNLLLPIVQMLLRICVVVGARGGGLYVPGLAKVLPILQRFNRDVQVTQTAGDEQVADDEDAEAPGDDDPVTAVRWFPPTLDLVWPPYFAPTDAEASTVLDAVTKALDAKLITRKQGVEKLKPWFPFDNVAELMEAIDEESAAAQTQHADGFHAAMSRLAAPADDDDVDADAQAEPAAEPAERATPDTTATSATSAPVKIELTSTDIASIVTVNEARRSQGLPDMPGPDGDLTVAEFQAKHAATVAAAANAAAGDAGAEAANVAAE